MVNNAALNFLGEIELTTMEQFERVTRINMMGTVRVTKACLPLLRNSKGTHIYCTYGIIHDDGYSQSHQGLPTPTSQL